MRCLHPNGSFWPASFFTWSYISWVTWLSFKALRLLNSRRDNVLLNRKLQVLYIQLQVRFGVILIRFGVNIRRLVNSLARSLFTLGLVVGFNWYTCWCHQLGRKGRDINTVSYPFWWQHCLLIRHLVILRRILSERLEPSHVIWATSQYILLDTLR